MQAALLAAERARDTLTPEERQKGHHLLLDSAAALQRTQHARQAQLRDMHAAQAAQLRAQQAVQRREMRQRPAAAAAAAPKAAAAVVARAGDLRRTRGDGDGAGDAEQEQDSKVARLEATDRP